MSTETWIVVDTHTGLQVGDTYSSGRKARRAADRLDNDYGAYRYQARRCRSEMVDAEVECQGAGVECPCGADHGDGNDRNEWSHGGDS